MRTGFPGMFLYCVFAYAVVGVILFLTSLFGGCTVGTPLPENPVGIDNAACWGVGEEFGDSPTPQIVTMTLSSLEEGDLWDEKYRNELFTPHLMYQTVDPEIWEAANDLLVWRLFLTPIVTQFAVWTPLVIDLAFVNLNLPPCVTAGPNELVLPANAIAFNGYFSLNWNEIFDDE